MAKGNLILAVLSGAVLSLAMPKPGIWAASWVGLALLLAAMRNTRVPRALLLGLIAGVVYFGVILFWITLFGYLPWILLTVLQALFFAVFGAIAARGGPETTGWVGYLAVPAAWTVMQWLRSLGPYGFPWGGFAHTQADNTTLIQIASVTGPWGIDFLVCLANLAIAQAVWPIGGRSRFTPITVTAVLVAATVLIGQCAVPTRVTRDRRIKVAMIQGSLAHSVNPGPGFTDRSYALYRKMSIEAARRRPDLIVWPESALPARIDELGWGRLISALAAHTRTSYLIGGYDTPENPREIRSYNSAHLFGPDGRKLGVYHKVHLVPYGEFVPLRDRLPFLKNYGIREVDVLPGRAYDLMRLGRRSIGVAICFESLFPQISRVETRGGAELLFVLTNDSWFQRTQAGLQHLMMARLRAVETRRYIARAASTGISAIIDPYGRITEQLGLFKRGIVTGEVGFRTGLTPYARFGDWFAYACVILLIVQEIRWLSRNAFRRASALWRRRVCAPYRQRSA